MTIGNATMAAIGMFIVAAMLLLAVIASARLGHIETAKLLQQIAGPFCAIAVCMLAQLAMHSISTDSEA